jgi:hypothetical protein
MKRRLQDYTSPFVRFLLGGNAMLTWYSAHMNPESTLSGVASTDDGGIFLFLIGLSGAVMVADLIINDWTPDSIRIAGRRFKLNWQRTWSYRHWLFVIISASYAAQPQIVDTAGQPITVKIIVYWWAAVYMMAAFLDAGDRSRRIWWQTACRG